MPLTKRLMIDTVNIDDEQELDLFCEVVISTGMERVRAELAAMEAEGIIDAQGRSLRPGPPPEMQENAAHDFGGYSSSQVSGA